MRIGFARSPIQASIINGNGGGIPDGSWQGRAGPCVTIRGAGSPCRIEIPETSLGVTLAGFSGAGYFGIQNYASRFT